MISIDNVSDMSTVDIIPNFTDITVASAWMKACIITGVQSTNCITIYAFGNKPTLDISITVLVGDEVIS